MPTRPSGLNPANAGPKGALAERPAKKSKTPTSGAPGAEGNNTRRDFVKLPKKKQ